MVLDRERRRAVLAWFYVGALLVFCGILGYLQYGWIGEVTLAERERLRASLQASLLRLRQDFDSEITSACRGLMPVSVGHDAASTEEEVAARYEQWRKSSHHASMFARIALAEPRQKSFILKNLDLTTGEFAPAEWPPVFNAIRHRLEAGLAGERWPGRGDPDRPPLEPRATRAEQGMVMEIPLFTYPRERRREQPFGRREATWILFELNFPYLRDVILPEVLQRHLGSRGNMDYQVEVVTRGDPPKVVYQSGPGKSIQRSADASTSLFELQYELIFHHTGSPPDMRESGRGGPGAGPGPDRGRWQLYVRHRAGSLEALVARARTRNLAVTGGVLLLMLATAGALVRYTRRAQKLAELQMDFVAGVSHELRTPLTVIHTAAYNLRGPVASNPVQVERYGTLIQQESGRLKELVERILRFASVKAGRVINETAPLSVESLIEETMESCKNVIQAGGCVVEKSIAGGLPPVQGDPAALKQTLQNLIENAVKYGSVGSAWIGISASLTNGSAAKMVEIRVSDRGPGIPADEREHIFDPFFRGRKAVQDQIHGAGLGLNLVKKIVEAHGGDIRVESQPAKLTQFIVCLPIANSGARE